MRVVIQRAKEASCYVQGERVGAINRGVVIFLGVEREDTSIQAEYLVKKIVNLRIFEDSTGKMNLSLLQIKG
ncbi:D-aminoacyl-tRNA deacylase, partial [Candidatus Aerophobetes bacterium]|nr:D-aminoacyl-tRNA deacylase [Candidatus Aerophobetes bacterium]